MNKVQSETNNVDQPKEVKFDQQEATPQKPMSIEAYTSALRKEAEVAKLRATIAKSMFEENMAMFQLNQLRAGNIGQPQATQQTKPVEDPIGEQDETTDKVAVD